MILIERGPLLETQVVTFAVVPIVLEHSDLRIAQCVDDAADDRGFSGAGSSGHANDDRRHGGILLGSGLQAPGSGSGYDRSRKPEARSPESLGSERHQRIDCRRTSSGEIAGDERRGSKDQPKDHGHAGVVRGNAEHPGLHQPAERN